MSKVQNYTIVFNTAQSDVDAAMQSIGSQFSTDLINLVAQQILLDNIMIDSETLSDDGLTLTVQRTWTDIVYDSLIAIQSVDSIRTQINNLSHVSSVTYDFTDA